MWSRAVSPRSRPGRADGYSGGSGGATSSTGPNRLPTTRSTYASRPALYRNSGLRMTSVAGLIRLRSRGESRIRACIRTDPGPADARGFRRTLKTPG
jgi:hypothetical protein